MPYFITYFYLISSSFGRRLIWQNVYHGNHYLQLAAYIEIIKIASFTFQSIHTIMINDKSMFV